MMLKMMRKGSKGFTLVEIMIVVAIIGLLAAIAIPNFVRARTRAQQEACIANLRQIEGAAQVWAVDTGADSATAVVIANLSPDYIRVTPVCPSNGTYAMANVASRPTCTVNGHVLP